MCKYEYTQLEFRGTQLHTKIEAFAYTMKIIIVYLDIMDCNSMLNNAKTSTLFKFHKNKNCYKFVKCSGSQHLLWNHVP